MEISFNLESNKSQESMNISESQLLIAVQEYRNYLTECADKQDSNDQASKVKALLSICVEAGLCEPRKFLTKNGQINNATQEYSNYLDEFLVKKDIDKQTLKGNTPLMVAVKAGLIESVKFLLSRGADIDIVNFSGQTLLDIAQENGHEEIASLISYYQETTDEELEITDGDSQSNSSKKKQPEALYSDADLNDFQVFICSKLNCGRVFYNQENLDKHLKRHDAKRKVFVCDHPNCNKAYTAAHNLKSHKKIHTDQAFSCRFCDKKFYDIRHLASHERFQTKEKPL